MCSSTITTFVFVYLLWKSSAIDVKANDEGAVSEKNYVSWQNETTTSYTTRIRPLLFETYNAKDVRYLLYTRENPNEYQELKTNDTASLSASHFDFNKKTKIIVHGYLSNGTSSVPEEIKDAYLHVIDVNIINVDWSKYADILLYPIDTYNVASVGKTLTDFLVFLVNNGLKTSELHLIGHSLGAHVVGIAGKYYYREKKPINIISALDPAKPFFEWSDKDNRLDKSDARHVEVIHTCGDNLGFLDPLGHLDFYPNGGRNQSGCEDSVGICAHHRAAQYFAESITSSVPFTAVKCKDFDEVRNGRCNRHSKQLNMSGLHLDVGYEGIYYLMTKEEAPFAYGSPDNWPDSS